MGGRAVDDECRQDNDKQTCSGERPPVIAEVPWVGPSAVMAWAYHVRTLSVCGFRVGRGNTSDFHVTGRTR